MKNTSRILIILAFLVCAFIGFKFADDIIPESDPSQIVIPSDSASIITQQNYLLVHVTDKTAAEPELISAWVALVYPSNPPQIIFMPLYPSYENRIERKLGNSFQLTNDQELSSQFIRQIEKAYDLHISGYIVADDFVVSNSNLWLTGQESQIVAGVAQTEEEKHSVRLIGQTSYQQFCQLLLSGSGNSYFSAINWSLLLPDHFSTNLPFESFMLTADQIIRAGSLVQCSVLSSE